MSIHIHELKSLKMYNVNNKLFMPLEKQDKKKNSMVFLLTPSLESSINMINSSTIINRNWFKSYYLEKSINVIVNNENCIEDIVPDNQYYELVFEDKLLAKERNSLKSSDFGIPLKKKYPINDIDHIKAAIRMFNHVSKEDEETLAKNIIKKLKEMNITDIEVSEKNRFYKYYHPIKEEDDNIYNSRIHGEYAEEVMNEDGLKSKDSMIIFDDIFNESKTSNSSSLRKVLYTERIKNQKEILDIYKTVKNNCTVINNTKLDYSLYKSLNLFVDTSYYNRAFFENSSFTKDRAINLYLDLINRLINNRTIEESGYTRKTIFIPVSDWILKDIPITDYSKSTNPISTIVRLFKKGEEKKVKEVFKNIDVVFFGSINYFKINFSEFEKKDIPKFIININNIVSKTPVEDDSTNKDSKDAIVTDIIDKLETSQKIKLYGVTGEKREPSEEIKNKKESNVSSEDTDKKISEKEKKELVDKIENAATVSSSTEEALEKLDNDNYVSNLIEDISNEENNNLKISAARTARINTINKQFQEKSINGKKISEYIEASNDVGDKEELPVTSVKVNSINKEQWDNLQFINFNKEYNVDEDILSILNFFSTRTIPIGILDVKVEDTSTSEDYIETWTVKCEDIIGTRFQLKFDIPKFINNRFMRLRGNDKTINGQFMNLPILKTENDTCQITTNYNKIFFRIFGTALGKSNVVSDKIIKAIKKYDGKAITARSGRNTIGSLKYDLPIDYIDFSNEFSTISYKDTIFYFSQDEIRHLYEKEIDLTKGLPIGYNKTSKQIIYTNGEFISYKIAEILCQDSKFKELFEAASPGVKYSYSKASIMNTTIPIIVICAYCEGLIATLNKAKINFNIIDKKERIDCTRKDMIKFKDAYLVYDLNYESSLLMNGLKECNTEDYSIKEINTKSMWINMLDLFGGRLKSDGIDNFYDLEFDPITIRTCEAYKLPYDFCEALIYANNLLVDSKFNKHVDIRGNRLRTNELVAGYTYKELSKSYAQYRILVKKTGKGTMSIKQSAIIDSILQDNTTSDASTINDLCYAEASNTLSFKGLSGMNSDRSYSLEKRTYDESMNGIIAMSTGFAGTVGVTRQGTINSNVLGKRGYVKDTSNNKELMNDVNSLCISEALTPLSTTHDDPFREAMSFVQRTKHDMRVQAGDPLLLTNGMDDALVNFTPDYFSVVAKDDGKIVERTNDHIFIKYNNGEVEYVSLKNKVYKNSDGGFYTSIKLAPYDNLKNTVKKGDLIAYDPKSYTVKTGYDDNPSYNQGSIAKVAIVNSDDGFEDSCAVNNYISKALSSEVITQVPVSLNKNTNVFNLVKVGQKIEEGEPLMIIQNTFEDNDVNILLKNLVDDEDTVTSLGRIPIKSHNTGTIEDIKIYRTCEINELSDSLKKIVTAYEKEQNKIYKSIEKYDPSKAKRYANNYKLDTTGKLKKLEDGVLIEIYVKYIDDFGIGDKLIFLGGQKGVAKDVWTKETNPYSEYRPEETIDAIASMISFDKRMITSSLQYCLAYKGLIELDRQVKDIMGIKQTYSIHHEDLK